MAITEYSSHPSWLLGVFLYGSIKARDDSCCILFYCQVKKFMLYFCQATQKIIWFSIGAYPLSLKITIGQLLRPRKESKHGSSAMLSLV